MVYDKVGRGEGDSEIAKGIPSEGHQVNTVCQNIPKHSIIVIENAPYQTKNTENYPNHQVAKSNNLLIVLQNVSSW